MELNPRERLAINLTDTSKAYGYTLCVWGSGAVMIAAYGFPSAIDVLLYVTGAVAGFGLLVLLVYGTLFKDVEDLHNQKILAATMIHLIAAPVTVFGSFILTQHVPATEGFFIAGLNATIGYNVLLLVETQFYEELRILENTLQIQQRLKHHAILHAVAAVSHPRTYKNTAPHHNTYHYSS